MTHHAAGPRSLRGRRAVPHGNVMAAQDDERRRQKWMELMWGDADYHWELVAQALEV